MTDVDPKDAVLADRLRGLPDPAFKRWLKESLMAMVAETRTLGPAARIGLIADTHGRQADGSDLPDHVLESFAGVDLIIHCGDIGSLGILNRLETVAPIIALRGEADLGIADPRVATTPQLIEAGGVRLGIVFRLEEIDVAERAQSTFGAPVDVIACGATHRDMVGSQHGVLLVNPGSPTLPAVPRTGERGTVAILEFRGGMVTAEIVRIRGEGENVTRET